MADTSSKSNYYAALFGGAVLLWGAYSALILPGGEYPMPPMHFLEMAFDLGLTIAIAGLTFLNLRPASDTNLRSVAILVGCAGVIAGLVQLGIRFHSDHGWWTGHFNP
jgi:hypothetical protein